jgi:hypothetical protein
MFTFSAFVSTNDKNALKYHFFLSLF